ncbi:MAG: hypothetical protein AMK75_02955 [Planctomycetes bacterium SM23_65]|nr:MAG: hypothetical protein AMK75_02955 [Planctomycetes bacterium SM23_65]
MKKPQKVVGQPFDKLTVLSLSKERPTTPDSTDRTGWRVSGPANDNSRQFFNTPLSPFIIYFWGATEYHLYGQWLCMWDMIT